MLIQPFFGIMWTDFHPKGGLTLKRFFILLHLVCFVSLIVGCQRTFETYDVYTTVYPLAFLVERIGQDVVTVGLVPGVTSHHDSVDWSAQDIIAMTNASYLFYIGAGFDAYIDQSFIELVKNKNVELVKLETAVDSQMQLYVPMMEGIHHEHDHDGEEDHHETTGYLGLDPHFWMSPKRMIQAARLVYDKLVLKYPNSASALSINYQLLLQSLQELSDSFQAVIDTQTNLALTATNIYGYLREDYGFHSLSISPGYHEETEQFTTQEKDNIVQEALIHNIRFIFFEKNSSSPLSNAIVQSLKDAGVTVTILQYHILHNLFQDDVSAGRDYLQIMQSNLEFIRTATVSPEME